MYNSVEELLERAKTENKRLHEVIAQNEMSISDISEEMLYDRLEKHYQTMVASAAKAVNAPQDMPGVDFIKGQSLKQAQYSESQTLGGSYLNNIMTMALSCCEVNAGMGRICAAPTAGACGILPAVLIETSRKLNSTKKEILDALLVAAGFGAIFVRNSTVSGAEGGCQAECGSAAAMAAAALVYLEGGNPQQCADAAAFALMNLLGLVCDPVSRSLSCGRNSRHVRKRGCHCRHELYGTHLRPRGGTCSGSVQFSQRKSGGKRRRERGPCPCGAGQHYSTRRSNRGNVQGWQKDGA